MCPERLSYIFQYLCAFCIFVAREEFLRCMPATRSVHAASNFWHSCCKARWSSECAIRNWFEANIAFTWKNSSDWGEGSSVGLALVHENMGSNTTTALCLGKTIKTTTDVAVFWITIIRPDLSPRPRSPCRNAQECKCQCCWKWDTTNQGSREPFVLLFSHYALCKIRQHEADFQSTANMLHVRSEQLKGYHDFFVPVQRFFPWACKHCPHTINVVPKALQQFPPRDLYQTIEVILETEKYETNHSLRSQNRPPKDERPHQGIGNSCTSDPHWGSRNHQDWLRKQ